jgi:hypothetical protein
MSFGFVKLAKYASMRVFLRRLSPIKQCSSNTRTKKQSIKNTKKIHIYPCPLPELQKTASNPTQNSWGDWQTIFRRKVLL